MKNSVLFLILIIGLVGLGYVVETKFGTITTFLSDHGILESYVQQKDLTEENNTKQSQVLSPSKISIKLPEYFEMQSQRVMATSLVPFEKEINTVWKKQDGVSELALTVSQYFSKDGFEKSLSELLNPNVYGGPGVVSSPEVVYKIGGEDAVEYAFSLYNESSYSDKEVLAVYRVISIPSQFSIITFEDPVQYDNANLNGSLNPLRFELSLSEIRNIISLIRFENGVENILVSEKKTPEEAAMERKFTHTEEALGLIFNLPESGKVMSEPSSNSGSDSEADQIFVLLNDSGTILISKYKTKEVFEKFLSEVLEMENKNPKEEGVVYYPIERYQFGGQDFVQFYYSINNVYTYQVFNKSKLVSFSFVPQVFEPLYSVDDIKDIIHSVKFNY